VTGRVDGGTKWFWEGRTGGGGGHRASRPARVTSVVGIPLLECGRLAKQQRADVAAAFATRDQARAAAHHEAELPALVPFDVRHLAEIYQQRTLDLHEAQRLEALRYALKRRPGQELLGAGVRNDIVARGGQVLHLVRVEEIYPARPFGDDLRRPESGVRPRTLSNVSSGMSDRIVDGSIELRRIDRLVQKVDVDAGGFLVCLVARRDHDGRWRGLRNE